MPVIMMTMNEAKLASLPEDVRNIILEVGSEWEAANGAKMDEVQAFGLNALKENGATIRTLPEEVRADWAASLAGFPKQQLEESIARGEPALEVMQGYIDAAIEIGHDWPVVYDLN